MELATACLVVTTLSSPADLSHLSPIVYAAHTASCTFLLDSEGFCRRIVLAPNARRSAARTAARCVDAQYVASLDGRAAGRNKQRYGQ